MGTQINKHSRHICCCFLFYPLLYRIMSNSGGGDATSTAEKEVGGDESSKAEKKEMDEVVKAEGGDGKVEKEEMVLGEKDEVKNDVEIDEDDEDEEKGEEEKEEEEGKDEEEDKDEDKEKEDDGDEDEESEDDEDNLPSWAAEGWEILEPGSGLLERPYILEEGRKRERKKTERIDVNFEVTPKEKGIDIPEGRGEKLGDMPRVDYFLNKKLSTDLRKLHGILFGKAGNVHNIKSNIRKFCGFAFDATSPEYDKKLASLNKMSMALIKENCEILDVERSGQKGQVIDRLMTFLLNPEASGKALPGPKRKSEKKRKRKRSKKCGEDQPEKKKKKVE